MNKQIRILDNKLNSADILADLKSIIGDYYVATMELFKNELHVSFVNGQQFVVFVNEV